MERVFGRTDSRIGVRAGDIFVLELEGNPTAGYRWSLNSDTGDKLRVVSHDVQAGGPGIGASAKERFRVEALAEGAGRLRAEYKRAWESEARQSLLFSVEIGK
jgi:predicted secreted protein